MPDTKQIIVMRKDLGMTKGKMIAQGAHAAMAFLTRRIGRPDDGGNGDWCPFTTLEAFSEAELAWLRGIFTKICVYVKSEQELRDVYQQALDVGLTAYLIEDAGLTQFAGVRTATCVGIGPDWAERVDPVTRSLPLL